MLQAQSQDLGATVPAPQRSPWLWVPSLYFSQGIPYVIVMTMSVVMYKRLGLSNTDIALYTSWLYLPWVIKPLWSPLVDITRTKRGWIVAMQFLISGALALVALTVPARGFFRLTLSLFWIMALASATHDIAADGFYMLSLSKHQQAWWVGFRSTFYRTAMIVGSGLLVVLAGVMENKNGLPPAEITVEANVQAPVAREWTPVAPAAIAQPNVPQREGGVPPPPKLAAPIPAPTSSPSSTSSTLQPPSSPIRPGWGALRLVLSPPLLEIALTNRTASDASSLIQQANRWNQEHGFLRPSSASKTASPDPRRVPGLASKDVFARLGAFWSAHISGPLASVLGDHFPKESRPEPARAGNVGAVFLRLSGPPPAGQSMAVNFERKKSGLESLGLAKGDKGFRVVEGERLIFDSTNWNQPGMAVIQLDPKLKQAASALFAASCGNIPLAWAITLCTVAGLFLLFSLWHALILPQPAADGPVRTTQSLTGEFFATLGSFFKKPGVWMALAFILSYRFDEAQLGKVISPFLLDSRAGGGLGLSTSQVGLAYGTFGILALTCGGLLGGFAAARQGLKTMLPVMVCSMYLPKLVFVFLSFTQPENFLVVCAAVALEQFGYGFGFTAFMLYMLYFADGPHRTAHYAICTGFMALGMMIPGMWSGWLADVVGYKHFFAWVIGSTIPGFVIAMLLKVDPQFGRK